MMEEIENTTSGSFNSTYYDAIINATSESINITDYDYDAIINTTSASSNLTNNNTVITTTEFVLPIDMRFNEGHVLSIIIYSILIVISAIGNSTVLILIQRRKGKTRSRINTMLMHLAIADLLVTFILMPTEIGWAYTVSWEAGDVMCRIMMFFRMFGVYLSSFILVCISVDRYFAILKPLHLRDVTRRGKVMLIIAWSAATLCSIPQMIVFHVEAHPEAIPRYEQCITINTFPTPIHELTYSLFGMITMYVIPLVVIIYSYASIIAEIYERSRESFSDKIRRSSLGFLGRAKIRTLKMTVVIILAFFVCWTPYYVMSFWYWVDPKSAKEVDQRIQKALFLFACTNSCVNPIVYGAFNIRNRNTDPGTSQKIASGTSRRGAGGVADIVCRTSWRQSLSGGGGGGGSRNQKQNENNLVVRCRKENLGIFAASYIPNEDNDINMENKNNVNNLGEFSRKVNNDSNCFTITSFQPRTTII